MFFSADGFAELKSLSTGGIQPTANGWVLLGNQPHAEAFSVYLAKHCEWTLEQFGSGYPWETDVSHPDDWENEVDALNDHLRSQAV